MKQLNIGLVGYGFMGRTHSNAFRQAPIFFDLPWKPVLKAVAARNEERAAPHTPCHPPSFTAQVFTPAGDLRRPCATRA